MNWFARFSALGLTSALVCLPMCAQKAHHPVSVVITCTCDDPTGQAYVSALREALASNAHYKELRSGADMSDAVLRINIISLPLEERDGRPQAALSVVCLHDGALMHQFVETCTHIPIVDCAASMVRDLEKWDGPAV